jgi:hypothetical protein
VQRREEPSYTGDWRASWQILVENEAAEEKRARALLSFKKPEPKIHFQLRDTSAWKKEWNKLESNERRAAAPAHGHEHEQEPERPAQQHASPEGQHWRQLWREQDANRKR